MTQSRHVQSNDAKANIVVGVFILILCLGCVFIIAGWVATLLAALSGVGLIFVAVGIDTAVQLTKEV